MKDNEDPGSPQKRESVKGLLDQKIDRRSFLQKGPQIAGALAGIGLVSTLPFIKSGMSPFVHTSSKTKQELFTLGVASGDPLPGSVVLWTRLALDPLNGGGMSPDPVNVHWEMARDKSFKQIVKEGTAVARYRYGHSIHIEAEGLDASQWYYYRFKVDDRISPTGRTKTAPPAGSRLHGLNFAFASCQNYPAGFYSVYDHLIKEDIDVLFFLGDYIYEGGAQGTIGRGHLPQKEVTSLEDYRIRYGQYKSDPALQAVHAAFPWIVTLDDHEIKNNWAGMGPPYDNNEDFLARRAVAFQAYYEHMPLRESALPENIDMQLYRTFRYGDLAEFSVLDTRQFRTDYACKSDGKTEVGCGEQYDPSRTMLGHEQENWLFANLKKSSSCWNIIPQQVMMAQWDRKEGPGKAFSMDKWDGYTATRNRLFRTIKEYNVSNLVVLTGDSHKNWVNDLKEDFNNPESQILGAELMGTSITSGGDGVDLNERGREALAENAHIKFYNEQRGYVLCQLTKEHLKADFKVVPYVSKPGAPIKTRASFVVKDGKAGAVRT